MHICDSKTERNIDELLHTDFERIIPFHHAICIIIYIIKLDESM